MDRPIKMENIKWSFLKLSTSQRKCFLSKWKHRIMLYTGTLHLIHLVGGGVSNNFECGVVEFKNYKIRQNKCNLIQCKKSIIARNQPTKERFFMFTVVHICYLCSRLCVYFIRIWNVRA